MMAGGTAALERASSGVEGTPKLRDPETWARTGGEFQAEAEAEERVRCPLVGNPTGEENR